MTVAQGIVVVETPVLDGQCRMCGCTDERACPGGCWWVADDLCSSCWNLLVPMQPGETAAARETARSAADGSTDQSGAGDGTAFEYSNPRRCPCGRPLPVRDAHQPGRRARYCGRCRLNRRALGYLRAAARILEDLRDPDYDPEDRH